MIGYIPNKYHVLDQDYKYIGTVIAQKSLEQAVQKGKALILSKKSLSCPHPIIVSDRKVMETNGAVLSSPLIEAELSTAQLQHTPSPENGNGKIRKPFKARVGVVAGKKAPRKQLGA